MECLYTFKARYFQIVSKYLFRGKTSGQVTYMNLRVKNQALYNACKNGV